MPTNEPRPLSTFWILASVLIFVAVELWLGGYVGRVIVGRYVSTMMRYQVQVLLHLASFFVGGTVVGILSPGVRMVEPAIGAFLSVGITLLISVFLPSWYMHFSFTKLLVGGAIAFALAYSGARLGERLMGNLES